MRFSLGYPAREELRNARECCNGRNPIDTLQAVATADDCGSPQASIRECIVRSAGPTFIPVRSVHTTRNKRTDLASRQPRGERSALFRCAGPSRWQADPRPSVLSIPDDVKKIIPPGHMDHRVNPATGESGGET